MEESSFFQKKSQIIDPKLILKDARAYEEVETLIKDGRIRELTEKAL